MKIKPRVWNKLDLKAKLILLKYEAAKSSVKWKKAPTAIGTR